eukprot:GEMP01045299.1.p1 GENE.GEMP01045299.1~~GEMP01045299.1.p1  ORF type:complete len:501 (+),score=156.58 GEMP01045299.1:30-1505(+)
MKQLLETRAARRLKKVSKRGQRRLEEKNEERYKMVRFVEKRKIYRQLKQCRAKLATLLASGESTIEGEDEDALRKQLAQLEDDKNYVVHYPMQFPYLSLLIKDPSPATLKRREELRALVHEAVVEKRKRIAERLEQKQDPERDDFFENNDEAPPMPLKKAAPEASEKPEGETRDQRRWRLRMERKAREAAAAGTPCATEENAIQQTATTGVNDMRGGEKKTERTKPGDTPPAPCATEKNTIQPTSAATGVEDSRCGGEEKKTERTKLTIEGGSINSAGDGEREKKRKRTAEDASIRSVERRKKKKLTTEGAMVTSAIIDGERIKKKKTKTIKGASVTSAEDGDRTKKSRALDENVNALQGGASEDADSVVSMTSKKVDRTNSERVTPASTTEPARRPPADTVKKKQRVPSPEQDAPSSDRGQRHPPHGEKAKERTTQDEGKARKDQWRQEPCENYDEPTHPAWVAANTVQRRGCIIKEVTNQRVVFDDDSD